MKTFKQHLEESFKRYEHTGEGFGPPRNAAEPWRGPHEGREFEMMMAGVKPAADVTGKEYKEKFEPHVKSGRFVARKMKWGPKNVGYIVGLKGEKYRVDALHREFSKPGRNHAKIGMLLGYPRDHIRKFLADA